MIAPIDPRVGCSSISFRRLPLAAAVDTIEQLGFAELDLGALPGTCDHVPYDLSPQAVGEVAATMAGRAVSVRSVNADIGDLNVPLDAPGRAARDRHLEQLLELAVAVQASALVLPCGALSHRPVRSLDADLDLVAAELQRAAEAARTAGLQLWVEHLHIRRLSHNLDIAGALADRLPDSIGVVLDVSHVVASGGDPAAFIAAFGPRIRHVHLRDARPGGEINLSIGNGDVDFPAVIAELDRIGYAGRFSLELETRDVTESERPAAARSAGQYISTLLAGAPTGSAGPTASSTLQGVQA